MENEENSARLNNTAAVPIPLSPPSSALQSKNIRIHKHRTSVRLEPEMWDALKEIATAEGCTIHDLCGAVHDLKDPGTSFTAALRVFMMEYYRAAARASAQVTQVQQKVRESRAQLQPGR